MNKCMWFAKCENDATNNQAHPILGLVPICESCRSWCRQMGLAVACALLAFVSACGGGGDSKPAACVAPSGVWSLKLTSSAECGGEQSLKEDFTKLDVEDGCVLVAQEFDDKACVFMQAAECEGYTATLVFPLDASGSKLDGATLTIENDDGTTCDFDVEGNK